MPSKGRGRKTEKNWRRNLDFTKHSCNSVRTGTSSVTPWSSWNWCQLDVRAELWIFCGRHRCQPPARDDGWGQETLLKVWSRSGSPSSCLSALKPHVQRVNHPIVLYKRAEEPILEQPKPYDDRQGWRRTDDGVLIFWTLVIVRRTKTKRRTRLTLMISVKAMVNDVLIIIILKPMRGWGAATQ